MMNKQRFSVVYEKFTSKDIIPKGIMDNKKNNHMCRIEEVCGLLNEQQATINKLKSDIEETEISIKLFEDDVNRLSKENEQLRQSVNYWQKKYEQGTETLEIGEQQATISQLQDLCGESDSENAKLRIENKQLRQMIKENVFQRYTEGSLADLEFKAIAYDDIVKLEISNESEPKVIVSCKQGKKENVKSFCQMFIPFGVYYEIKELEDE